jgi:hypothetical protein
MEVIQLEQQPVAWNIKGERNIKKGNLRLLAYPRFPGYIVFSTDNISIYPTTRQATYV